MDDIIPKLVGALATAVVGFFWLLAYKHPRTFKAISAPFAFLSLMAVFLALPFGFAAVQISSEINIRMIEGQIKLPAERDFRDKLRSEITEIVAPYQRYSFYVAGAGGFGLAFLSFFAWVSRALQKERDETAKSEADAKEKKSKEENVTDGP
jgi:hypothetical protein